MHHYRPYTYSEYVVLITFDIQIKVKVLPVNCQHYSSLYSWVHNAN